MSEPVIGTRDERSATPRVSARPLRILFFMRAANYDRHFEGALRELLGRGHTVHVALDVAKKGKAGSTELFDRLAAEGDLTYGLVPERRHARWPKLARQLRLSVDYLRYLDPRFADAHVLRERAEERAPRAVVGLARLPVLRSPRGVRTLDRFLRALERALPVDPALTDMIDGFAPDVVLVTPLVGLGSPQGDYVRAARAAGVPTAFMVASWDNLTNKGVVRDPADLTVVWNGEQLRECVELHGLAAESVCITGAHTYDHWFGWEPSTSREEFLTRVGLRPDRPTILYVCSSGFIAPDEAASIARWLRLLRASTDERLREANVLVRPHPANVRMWEEANISDPGRLAIWPREGASPTTHGAKADYYDSIYHAAVVVGVNTSALVESAIVGRPVLSLVGEDHVATQEGTLHFRYLTGENGVLTVARDEEEHVEQLARALADEAAGRERCARFVESFLRPHGRAEAAAPRVADALEQLAGSPVAAVRARRRHAAIRAVLAPPLYVGELASRARPGKLAPRAAWKTRRPGAGGDRPLRVLFCFDHPGSLLHFDETIRGLAVRGHRVHVAFARTSKYEDALDVLARDDARVVVHTKSPRRADRYAFALRAAWALMDFVHYLDPRLEQATFSRAKWRDLAPLPFGLRWLKRSETIPSARVDFLLRRLRWLAEAIPPSPGIDRFLAKIAPDVVLVSPLVTRTGDQSDILKSARALGIPSALCLSSWDNLTSKGMIREAPDRVIVWNETQRREAIDYHGIDPDRVAVTGAQQFDRWFGRDATSDRETFLTRLGLPADKPFVLFVGSTRQLGDPELEPGFVRDWVAALRASDDPLLRDLSVVIRPHPTAMDRWDGADFSDAGGVVVARRDRALPVGDARADYYDAMHHCSAVVGINSTAMVEATIVGRPVHTVCLPEFRPLQHDLMHYHYLREENGGFLREAADLDQHLGLLAVDLREPESGRAAREAFVSAFIRPQGTDRAATDVLMNAIEEAAAVVPDPRRRALPSRVAGRGLAVLLGIPRAASAIFYRGVRRGSGIARRLLARLEGTRAGRLVRGPLALCTRLLDRADARARRKLKSMGAIGSVKEKERSRARREEASGERPLRVLFFVRHAGFLRNFQAVLVGLAEQGHELEVVLQDWNRRWLPHNPVKKLAGRFPNVTYSKEPRRRRRRLERFRLGLRRSIDHLHYLRPEFDGAPRLRQRVERRAPAAIRRLSPVLRPTVARRLAFSSLAAVERLLPLDPAVKRFVSERRPDVVVLTPLIHLSSDQHDYVRVARRRGIPTLACVASWDNLTTKGTFREAPDVVAVWNETQRREAVELHGLPAERVVATGAHTYDHWFDWLPSTTREEFAATVGLPAEQPFVLYVCSSQFVAPEEVAFVERWVAALRRTPGLAEIGVLVRPHPQNAAQWQEARPRERGVTVWPPAGADPVEEQSKNGFYDSMYHCSAVVGINTSALIEASVLGRPVLSIADGSFAETQEGTLHFAYLAEGERPLLSVARSLEQHVGQLAAAVHSSNGATADNSRAFVEAFVRPYGIDEPAAPRLVSLVERLARRERVTPVVIAPTAAAPVAWKPRLRRLARRPARAILSRLPVARGRLAARDARRLAAAEERKRAKLAASERRRQEKAAVLAAKEAKAARKQQQQQEEQEKQERTPVA